MPPHIVRTDADRGALYLIAVCRSDNQIRQNRLRIKPAIMKYSYITPKDGRGFDTVEPAPRCILVWSEAIPTKHTGPRRDSKTAPQLCVRRDPTGQNRVTPLFQVNISSTTGRSGQQGRPNRATR